MFYLFPFLKKKKKKKKEHKIFPLCISAWCNGAKHFSFIIIIPVKGTLNNVNSGGKPLGFICMADLNSLSTLGIMWESMGRARWPGDQVDIASSPFLEESQENGNASSVKDLSWECRAWLLLVLEELPTALCNSLSRQEVLHPDQQCRRNQILCYLGVSYTCWLPCLLHFWGFWVAIRKHSWSLNS